MNEVFFYLLKVSVFTILFYIFYWIVLRHKTFHHWNRIFLLSGLCLSFILPLIEWPNPKLLYTTQLDNILTNFDGFTWGESDTKKVVYHNIRYFSARIILIPGIYLLISLTILLRLIKSIYSIRLLKKNSDSYQVNGIDFFYGSDIKQPFSFLKWIFIPYSPNDNSIEVSILKHEKAHADQWHTLDLLFTEIIIIVLWFNPFVFFFRRSLRQVHEYLADDEVTKNHEVKADYLRLIVANAKISNLSGLASQFYWLTLKKRIHMITKNKSSKKHKLFYLFIIPIIALSTMAFSNINFSGNIPLDKSENKPNIPPIRSGEYKISSEWGIRKHPITTEMKMHNGIDLKAETGSEVIATADGMVIKQEFSGEGKGYGRVVVIQHNDTYSTLYAQLSAFKVQVGDMVKQGDVIGLVGKSGISTGPHLHYEIIRNGERVNPADYFE